MSNIKEVIINPNKPADVKFVQYDTGQKLYVKNSPDFDFTNTTEIQITDGTESASGQGTIVAPYTFFDEDAQTQKTVNVTIVANYSLSTTTQKIDTVHLTENITSSKTTGTAHPSVSVDSVSFDDASVESYSSISLVNPTIANGKIYAYIPQSIDFVYNQRSVSASYSGEVLRQQVGIYQHTQTAAKYSLGTQE